MILTLTLLALGCGGGEPVAALEGVAGAPTAIEKEASPTTPQEPGAEARPTRTASQKPLLSEKVREVVAGAKDAPAASNDLMSVYSVGLGDYETDEAGVLAVSRELLAAGDDARAEIVVSFLQMASYQVNATVSADVWAGHGDISLARGNSERARDMYEQALAEDPDHAYSKRKYEALAKPTTPPAKSAASPQQAASGPDIERRDDLARFRFRYADVDNPDRVLGITETCYDSGVLRVVPLWEDDATTWVFKSVSEGAFEQVNPSKRAKPVRLDFEFDRSDAAWAVAVSGPFKSRFEHAGYNPEGFEPERGTCQ